MSTKPVLSDLDKSYIASLLRDTLDVMPTVIGRTNQRMGERIYHLFEYQRVMEKKSRVEILEELLKDLQFREFMQ